MKTAAIGLNIPNIRLYDIFRRDLHLPDERAHDLVQAIDEAVKEGYEERLKGMATKEYVKGEIQVVKDELLATKDFVKGGNWNMRDEFQAAKDFVKAEVNFVKAEVNRVELKVEQLKSEVTKSIYWTSLVQFLAITGAIIGIISFMLRK